MRSKRRISKESPNYYVPLPYAMAVRRSLSPEEFDELLFEGMQLHLRLEGVVHQSIAVIAHINNSELTIGYIPKGMMSRVEGLMMHDEKILVTLEKKSCSRLKNAFWLCIDELPDLPKLSF